MINVGPGLKADLPCESRFFFYRHPARLQNDMKTYESQPSRIFGFWQAARLPFTETDAG
jgi:hypothetical protein